MAVVIIHENAAIHSDIRAGSHIDIIAKSIVAIAVNTLEVDAISTVDFHKVTGLGLGPPDVANTMVNEAHRQVTHLNRNRVVHLPLDGKIAIVLWVIPACCTIDGVVLKHECALVNALTANHQITTDVYSACNIESTLVE